ncbi:MAG TPA: TIGR03089 family protein [Actinomycetaceae bacterium]|nr:TIGR03089 family protein [Actinomycetaceae bacterium]
MQISRPSPGAIPSTTAELLTALGSSSRPAITYYAVGPDETEDPARVELSGKVLAQWAVKSANLFYEEGLEPGDIVVLDIPPSWRAVPWALGAWLQGCSITIIPHDDASAVVTTRPERASGDVVIAVTEDPLALRFERDLPPGVLDGVADVAGQADFALQPALREPLRIAVADAGIRFIDLHEVIGVGPEGRSLIVPTTVWDLIRRSVAAWRAGGSVVVVDERLPLETRSRAAAQEGAV